MQEKRFSERLELGAQIKIRAKDGIGPLFKATVEDLSLGGLRIQSRQRLELEEDFEFELKTKFSERPISGKACVRHVYTPRGRLCAQFSAGVKFTDADGDEVWSAIKNILKNKNKAALKKKEIAKDLTFMVKSLPLLLFASWLVVKSTTAMFFF
jgi:hypothetical protein